MGPISPPRRSLRHHLARLCGRTATLGSRAVGRGEGSVVGGAVAQRIDPTIAAELAEGKRVVLVSGTNGKTTTTRMVAEAVATTTVVAHNRTGANLANGIVGALMDTPTADTAVLEVDEGFVPWAMDTLAPDTVVLLNLSRDQLDRMHEVSSLAGRWRTALAAHPPRVVVANADDPLVVYAAGDLTTVWVGAGLSWTTDATTCLWCGGVIEFPESGWRCTRCDHRRPPCAVTLDGDSVDATDWHVELRLPLPGRSVRANAVMALAAADQLRVPVAAAVERWRTIRSIEGRYEVSTYAGTEMRLHLAKNPAGWSDTLDMLATDELPVILVLNARGQDGRDPSWIWDVPFEQLQGRTAVCLGERGTDLAVRLTYADVDAKEADTLREATALVGAGPVHVVANYSAFQQLRPIVARGR